MATLETLAAGVWGHEPRTLASGGANPTGTDLEQFVADVWDYEPRTLTEDQPAGSAHALIFGTVAGRPLSGTGAPIEGEPYGAPKGSRYIDRTAGKMYVNTGTAAVPVWTVVGTQS